jgi:hypothetical protein
MRLPGNPPQSPAGGGDPPLCYSQAFPAGATRADVYVFLAAAGRAGAYDDARLIATTNQGLIVMLACPVPDGGTTRDLSEVRPVTEQLDPGSAVNPGGGMHRGL